MPVPRYFNFLNLPVCDDCPVNYAFSPDRSLSLLLWLIDSSLGTSVLGHVTIEYKFYLIPAAHSLTTAGLRVNFRLRRRLYLHDNRFTPMSKMTNIPKPTCL